MKDILRKHYISAIVSIIILIGAVDAHYMFFSTMTEKEKNVIEEKNRLASFEQNKVIFEQEAIKFDLIKERIEKLEKYILTNESIPGLLSSLEALAKDRNIEFTITTVENNTLKEGVTPYLRVDFSAEGSLANIEGLVEDIISQSYQVSFSKFSLFKSDTVSTTTGSNENTKPSISGSTWQLLAGINIMSF